jgi:hypothetical protein
MVFFTGRLVPKMRIDIFERSRLPSVRFALKGLRIFSMESLPEKADIIF